jgi:hypothetical protein
MHQLLNFIVDFGETVIIVPAALVAALFLAQARQVRLLITWGATLAAVVAVTVLLRTPAIWPSGHVALSVAFYGGLAVLIWRLGRVSTPKAAAPLAIIAALFPVAITTAIAILKWHGLRGISLGLLTGAVTPLALAWAPIRDVRRPPVIAMVAATALILGLLHGWRLDYTSALAWFDAGGRQLSLHR